MTLNGITAAQFNTYQTQWKAALASALGVLSSSITVVSVNNVAGRHLLQTSSLTIAYTVQTTSVSSVQTAISNLPTSNFASTFNAATGLTTTLGASATAVPTSASASTVNLGLILGLSIGGAAFLLLAVGVYYCYRNPTHVNV